MGKIRGEEKKGRKREGRKGEGRVEKWNKRQIEKGKVGQGRGGPEMRRREKNGKVLKWVWCGKGLEGRKREKGKEGKWEEWKEAYKSESVVYSTQLNSTSIYGHRCKHLSVRMYLAQLL